MPISRRLVDLIERHADELTRNWLRDVRRHPGTRTYHTYDEDKLYNRAYDVYSHLGQWLSESTSKGEIAKRYTKLGRKRRAEGFKLSEVLEALVLTRRHVWLKVQEEGLLDTALDLHMAMQLSNRVIVFFDRAMYFVAVGYEEALV